MPMTAWERILRNVRYAALFGAAFSLWAIIAYLAAGSEAPGIAALVRIIAAYMGAAVAAGTITALMHPLLDRTFGRLLAAIAIAAAAAFALVLATGAARSGRDIALTTLGYALIMGPIGAYIFRPRR